MSYIEKLIELGEKLILKWILLFCAVTSFVIGIIGFFYDIPAPTNGLLWIGLGMTYGILARL